MKHHHYHHQKKPKLLTFKQFMGGTKDVLHAATIPARDLIGAASGGLKTVTGSVGSSLMVPLMIGGALVLVFYVTQRR